MLINRDEKNDHSVRVAFDDPLTKQTRSFTGTVDRVVFGSAEYQWHPDPIQAADAARQSGLVQPAGAQETGDDEDGDAPAAPGRGRSSGHADPDGPASKSTVTANGPDTLYDLPKASIVVLRGNLGSE